MRMNNLFLIVSMFLFINQIGLANPSPLPVVDSIAAIVNDDVVTKRELNKAVHLAKLQFRQSGMAEPNKNDFEKKVLQQLIDKKLQIQIAKQSGINVTEKDIDQVIRNIAMQNHVSVEQFYSRLSEEGLSKAQYRDIMKEELMMQRLQQQQISTKVRITPEEIKTYLLRNKPKTQMVDKEYAVIDVLLPLSDSPKAQEVSAAKENAMQLIAQVKGGKTLEHAIRNVQGEANDLGWKKLDDFPSAFVKAIAGMKTNDLSSPIETGNGFHVLKLVDVRDNSLQASTITQREAEEALMRTKIDEQVDQMVNKLRSQSYISIA